MSCVLNKGTPPFIVTIDDDVANRIYRTLVAFADADPDQKTAFVQSISTEGVGRGEVEWRLKAGYFGVTCLFICDNEWFVTSTREDLSPGTQDKVDTTNLKLAQLRDVVLTEQNP